jgi:hypothetical protein
VWPIIYLDALVMKVRDQGVVLNKHVYMALGICVSSLASSASRAGIVLT